MGVDRHGYPNVSFKATGNDGESVLEIGGCQIVRQLGWSRFNGGWSYSFSCDCGCGFKAESTGKNNRRAQERVVKILGLTWENGRFV